MPDTTIQGYPASALFDEEAGTISPLVSPTRVSTSRNCTDTLDSIDKATIPTN